MNLLKNVTFAILFSAISVSTFADFKLSIKNNLMNSSITSIVFSNADGKIVVYDKINNDNPLLPKKSRVIANKLNFDSVGFGAPAQINLIAYLLKCVDAEHHQCDKSNLYLLSNPVINPIINTVPLVIGSEIFETTKVIIIFNNYGNRPDSSTITPPYLRVDYRVIRKSTTTNAVNRTKGTLGYIHVFNT